MDYDAWLTYQRDHEPVLKEIVDPYYGRASLVDCECYGITLVRVEGGFLVLDSVYCRKRFPRLFEPRDRWFEGARPISTFLEPGYVFAPYIPVK